MRKYTAFTFVEIIFVIVIASLMLVAVFGLGWEFIDSLRYKQDRDAYINLIDEAMVKARTTNYAGDVKYTYLDIVIDETSVAAMYGTGDSDTEVCDVASLTGDAVNLEKSLFSGNIATPIHLRLKPFALGCDESALSVGCLASTDFRFSINALNDSYETCYEFDISVCKFVQVLCTNTNTFET